nr:hypothetical protein [Saccharofermentans sp.]
ELYMNGYIRAGGSVTTNSWMTEVTGIEENTAILDMPDWSESILAKAEILPVIDPQVLVSQDQVVANGYYKVTTYTYSSVGNLISVNDPTGTVFYTYNADGYMTSVTNANGEVIFYTYNDAGLVASMTIDEETIDYGYDNMGRLISVTDSEGTTNYTYDAVGNRATTEYPNGLTTTYEYNENNVLISQITTNEDGDILQSFEYTIGDNNERLTCTEIGRTVSYEYDELERLVSETVKVGDDVSVTTYTYDSNSNRISMDRDGEVTVYEYNELGQLVSAGGIEYTWDNAGNLVSQSNNGTIVASYTYDCHNRMLTATVNTSSGTLEQSYTYDYLGNRTSKTTDGVTTEFTTDLSTGYSQILKAVTDDEVIYYTRGFELIARRVGSDASYYIYDGGMSVRALSDETGSITDTYVFDAFGNETSRTGESENSYGFQGEEQDETGLYYLRARYMDPSTGTFTSMDTYAGKLSDPMSLHKYMFANSNPVKYCDPSGHFSMVDMCVGMAIFSVLCGTTYYILGEYFHVEKNEYYYGGLLAAFIVGAIIGALAGAFLIYMYGMVCFSLLLRTLCYIALLVGIPLCMGIGYMARVTGNEDIAILYESLGFYIVISLLLDFLPYVTIYLKRNKRGAIYIGGREAPNGWVDVNESMSEESREYQAQITGHDGQVWYQNGVKFDGMTDGTLIEVKGDYSFAVDPNTGEFRDWFTGANSMVDQANRQIAASDGMPICWYFSDESTMNATQALFEENGISGIQFAYVPAS